MKVYLLGAKRGWDLDNPRIALRKAWICALRDDLRPDCLLNPWIA